MISLERALQITAEAARPMPGERVPLDRVNGRVLAEDVRSDVDMPPFDKSAMDGYACRRTDLDQELTVIEDIPAGVTPKRSVGAGQCARIMTGAMVPEGADCVVMVEHTENPSEQTVRFTGTNTRNNICYRGEDVRADDVVLATGTLVRPEHVATLAAVGCSEPVVFVRPRVAVIATGNELVESSSTPGRAQIRNSNSPQLCAQLAQMGLEPLYVGIARDTEQSLEDLIARASRQADVVLLSGGVSMGDLDLVPGILARCGVTLLFETIAIKPGKPTVFGVSEDSWYFGLPGNPVSTFVLFELLVKPFLLRLMGHEHRVLPVRMPLGAPLRRKRPDRQSWVPVRLTEEGTLQPIDYHGSAHIHALVGADGLVPVPAGVTERAVGTVVPVHLLHGGDG